MFVQITMLSLISLFYVIYFAKAIMLKKRGISVDLLGKGDKPQKAARIEIVLKACTWIGAAIQFMSVIFPALVWSVALPFPARIIGVILTALGVAFFAVSVTVMRSNWRAGFSEEQETALVTGGIYRFSRNPAFVGFDLLYIGCVLAFPNLAMVLIAVTAVFAFHIQILGEEQFLAGKFGREYTDYKSKVRRYL